MQLIWIGFDPMVGIILVIIALVLTIVAAVLRLMAKPVNLLHWSMFVIYSVFLIEIALLWGNIGVIYSHAGWTG
jgi:hypothetical protein